MTIAAFAEAFAALDGESAALRHAVARHAADALAALSGGLATAEGAAIARFYATPEGGEHALTQHAAGAAAVIRFTECDAIHIPTCVTPGAISVPVALAFAADAVHFSAAVEAGFATGIALAEAVGGVAALAHGVWPTLLAAPAIAAVTTAVAAGFGTDRTAQALALALAGASGRGGRPGGCPSGRWLAIGEATLRGIRAALAARAGFSGDLAILAPDWLAAQAAPGSPHGDALVLPPPDAAAAVGLKPYVAARQGQNAIEAFRQLLGAGLDPDSVQRIEVSLPAPATGVVSRPLQPGNRLSGIAHLGLQLGLAAYQPERLLDIGRQADYDPRCLALAERVAVAAAADQDEIAVGTWPARLRVTTAAGTVEGRCDRLPGDAGDPETGALVQRKIALYCPEDSAAPLRELAAGRLDDATLGAVATAITGFPGVAATPFHGAVTSADG